MCAAENRRDHRHVDLGAHVDAIGVNRLIIRRKNQINAVGLEMIEISLQSARVAREIIRPIELERVDVDTRDNLIRFLLCAAN